MPGRFNPDDYVDVQERITRFWTEYPEGRITTDLMSLPDEFERVVFKAEIYKDTLRALPDATGWAAEVAGGQGANQTSWHENCETSAIGRALANMGYATKGKDRPSRQEMAKASRGAGMAATTNTAPAHDPRSHMTSKPDPRPIYQAPDITRETGEITDPPDDGSITKEQEMRLGKMMRVVGITEIPHRQNWLKKHGGGIDYHRFSSAKADRLIALLEKKQDEETQRGLVATTGPQEVLM
jgi:hypothetical protein